MNNLKVVIIEDEPAIARDLQYKLQKIDTSIIVVATLVSIKDAVKWLRLNEGNFHLIFADIRLNDGLSFAVFEQVKVSSPIIFVTAFEEYALKAFKTNGIDYILKPFDSSELQAALTKFDTLINKTASTQTLIHSVQEQLKILNPSYRKSFLLQYRDKFIPISTEDIAWFNSKNEITTVVCFDNRKFHIDLSLEQLQQQLESKLFFRANRQYIMQRKAIKEVMIYFASRLKLKVEPATPEEIVISKARVPIFKDWMNS